MFFVSTEVGHVRTSAAGLQTQNREYRKIRK